MPKHDMGEQTRYAKEYIADFNHNIADVDIHEQFRNGIYSRIQKLGYSAKTFNAAGVTYFVCEQFKKHNIQMPGKQDNTEINIKNWLTVSPPNDSSQSRDNVYKLCFALEMNAEQTEEFFLKSYLCRPFNFKDYRECVYYFCLNTGRSYAEAERLIAEIEKLSPENPDIDLETRNIGIALSEIVDVKDFLNEMRKYKYSAEAQRKTVTKAITDIEVECKKIADIDGRGSLLKAIYRDENRSIGNKFACREKKSLPEEIPSYIRTNFPLETTLSDIKNNKNVSNDRCRKMLILLFFYKFYGDRYKSLINRGVHYTNIDLTALYPEFETALDELLNRCGFVELYYRNPYDEFFLSCAAKCDPLLELRKMISFKD